MFIDIDFFIVRTIKRLNIKCLFTFHSNHNIFLNCFLLLSHILNFVLIDLLKTLYI